MLLKASLTSSPRTLASPSAAATREKEARRYVQLLDQAGGHGVTDAHAGDLLGLPLAAIQVLREACFPLVVAVDRAATPIVWRLATGAEQQGLKAAHFEFEALSV